MTRRFPSFAACAARANSAVLPVPDGPWTTNGLRSFSSLQVVSNGLQFLIPSDKASLGRPALAKKLVCLVLRVPACALRLGRSAP